MTDLDCSDHVSSRRLFLQSTAATAAVSPLIARGETPNQASKPAPAVHIQVDETLRVGLIGCGLRGAGAAIDALHADPEAKLVALADAFADKATGCRSLLGRDRQVGDRVEVPEEKIFVGFDAYKQLIDSGVDIVLLATPPHFRPQHLEYAIAQGKHCFVEKPVAVDAVGIHRVEAACQEARDKGLSVVSGLCWRYDHGVQETIQRIEDGAIGDIVAIESIYNAGGLWHRGDQPEWSRMEYQLRNWIYHTWLSGDIIAEQAVHSLDKSAWLLGDVHPIKAMGTGGRQQRVDPKYGEVFDHFSVFYEYEAGPRVYFTCRQQVGCTTHVDELVHGTKGRARILAHHINGETTWKYRGRKPSMYRVEHEALFNSIRKGEPIDDSHHMINSSMMAIMGRQAAYTGKTLTWDDAVANPERLGPTEYAWGDAPEPVVALPGEAS